MREAQLRREDGAVVSEDDVVPGVGSRRAVEELVQQAVELGLHVVSKA